MAIIEQTWTFFPGHAYSQSELVAILPKWLDGRELMLARSLFQHSAVAHRNLVVNLDDLMTCGRSFSSKQALYRSTVRDTCAELSRQIAETTTPEERESIELLITASCTGFQIPAMDAPLIASLELSRNVRCINLTEHGCAAGAAALGMAHEWLASRPHARALIVCVELASTTFLPEDRSDDNLVSAAIFGDGAAAVLVSGDRAERLHKNAPVLGFGAKDAEGDPKPQMYKLELWDSVRELFHGTEHFMGYEIRDEGFEVNLSRDILPFASRMFPDFFARMFTRFGLSGPHELSIGAIHPGGRRVLESLETDVGLPKSVTRTSWDTLEQHGNMSSVTVLVALDQLLRQGNSLHPGAWGLVTAFGPGFCAEISLIRVARA